MVFLLALFSGLGVFAVLIGFVNETVTSTIDGINEGQSKIAESGHTLTLGWNEFHTSQLPAIVSLLVHTWPDGSIAPGPRLNEPSPDTADIFCNLRGSIIFSIQYFRLEPEGYRDCSVADKSSLYSLCINCITRNISFFFAVFFSLSDCFRTSAKRRARNAGRSAATGPPCASSARSRSSAGRPWL